MEISNLLVLQRSFFNQHQTKDIAFRKNQLIKLKELIENHEEKIYSAIYNDFGKSEFETYLTEIGLVINSISYYLRHLKSLIKPKIVNTNFVNLPGSSSIILEPLGNCLIIGAWNYPFLLSLNPLIAAIAAGNTVILKPSEIAPNCSIIIAEIINKNFPPEYIYVAEGGINETTEILKHKFDKIFYTGSTKVGKIIYEAAAKNLSPVCLELGGKSPVLITENANLKIAAKRIVWGKFLNAGQTCVAPDYIIVHKSVKEKLTDLIKEQIRQNNYKIENRNYTKIINHQNFDRLIKLIDKNKVIYGGNFNRNDRFIEPTVLDKVSWDDEIMEEEIFGPILPILTFDDFKETINVISKKEKPLSAYLFSNNQHEINYFSKYLSFGGGCINDVVVQLSNENLPFGGIGSSGIGKYHGKFGFETFSNQKALLKKMTWGEPELKFSPYTLRKLRWIKFLLKL